MSNQPLVIHHYTSIISNRPSARMHAPANHSQPTNHRPLRALCSSKRASTDAAPRVSSCRPILWTRSAADA
eukprot:7379924-Prymnesium_polylepis.2